MVKKIFINIFSVILLLMPAYAVHAEDIFTPVEDILVQIDNLISECGEKGLSCDVQKANAEIVRKFIGFGRDDLNKSKQERAEYIFSEIKELADRTRTETERMLSLNRSIAVPQYNGTDIVADGINFKDSEGVNRFFGGYLIFSDALINTKDFKNMGNNFYSWEIGPNKTIVEEGTFLPSWQAAVKDDITIEPDYTVFHDGGTSIKFVCNTAMTSGYYAELRQDILVKAGKTYQVDIWIKADNARGNVVYLNGDFDKKTLPTGTYDWKKVSYEVKTEENQVGLTLRFIAQHTTDAIWIDSISVREKGRDFNLINNGDFETVFPENEFLVNQGVMNYIKSVLEEDGENRMAAMILLSPHYVPDWFWTNHPEAYGYQEGFLKGNVLSDTYKKFIKTHAQAVAQAVSGYPNLHSLVLTNEPMYNTIYYTNGKQIFKEDFINYLRKKYNSAEDVYVPDTMKKNWGITKSLYKWSEVGMPAANVISANGKFWDWMEYNNEVFTGFHKWMADMVHEVDESIPVHAKLYNTSFDRDKLDYGTDEEEIYSYLDYNGFDGGMNFESSREGYLQIRMAEDLAGSISKTPTVNSENHIIPDDCTDYSEKHALIAGADLWQGFLHGRTASAAWVWRRHDTYAEYRNSIAYRPDVAANISGKVMNANRFSGELTKLQNTECIFYILYSRAALLYNESEYLSAVNNAYEALWSIGQKASFVTEKQIAEGKLSSNAVLVIPSALNIDECALNGLNAFNGDVILIGNAPAKNEYNLDISLALKNKTEVSDNIAQIRAAYETILQKRNIPVITIKDGSGSFIDMTDIRAVEDNGSILINACNNTWSEKNNLSVYCGDKLLTGGYDVINDREFENDFTLSPFEPVLLRFYDEELFPSENIKNVTVHARNNGALIRWEGGTGIVTARNGADLMGSVLSKNEYLYINGLENGEEYTINLKDSKSDEVLSLRVIPGEEDVTVYCEGIGTNGYAYKIINNTNQEKMYHLERENIDICVVLPPWGEKYVQTGN